MNIAIWGIGVSGISALRYLSLKKKVKPYVIGQGDPNNWTQLDTILKYTTLEKCFDENDLSLIQRGLTQVVLSPGISKDKLKIKRMLQAGVEFVCEVELAFRDLPSNIPIIGVTGSNGKTTTVSMMRDAFEIAGKSVFLGGNIGTPFCDIFFSDTKIDLIVLELSSFQLESLDTFRADIAMILNVSENHMERYDSLIEYTNAKLNIFNNQTSLDLALIHKSIDRPSLDGRVRLIEKLPSTLLENSFIKGEHNLENLFCTQAALEFFEVGQPSSIIKSLVSRFKGVEFRQEYLGVKNNTVFINDSKSTNPAATMAAVKAFTGQRELCLIMGGKLRSEWQDLGSKLNQLKITQIIAIGEARSLIFSELSKSFDVVECEHLEDAATIIGEQDRGVVLFSPGFPSFDQYKNYIDRGQAFNKFFSNL